MKHCLHFFFFVNVPAICLLFILTTTCCHCVLVQITIKWRYSDTTNNYDSLLSVKRFLELIVLQNLHYWHSATSDFEGSHKI